MAQHATIDQYIAALPAQLGEIAAATRAVIDRHLEGASSAIRWSHPTWSLGADPVCYLKAASQHVTLGFWHGQSIADPSGRLESLGSIMAHATLRTVDDVDADLLADWLRQARELSRADMSEGP